MNSELDYVVRDLQRRIANMIRRGTIHSVDFDAVPPRVRVEYAKEVVSGWLPWVAGRTGHAASWEPIKVGESVLILSESGELSAGVVVPSISTIDMVLPDNKANTHVTRYEDGTTVTYDRDSHNMTIDVKGGDVAIKATGKITGDATTVHWNGGTGVVTNECICHFTGKPHSDVSTKVFAGK